MNEQLCLRCREAYGDSICSGCARAMILERGQSNIDRELELLRLIEKYTKVLRYYACIDYDITEQTSHECWYQEPWTMAQRIMEYGEKAREALK